MTGIEKLLYSPEEAAMALGISRSTLYVLLSDGQLASVRLGTRRRIEANELRRFVASLDSVPPAAVSAPS